MRTFARLALAACTSHDATVLCQNLRNPVSIAVGSDVGYVAAESPSGEGQVVACPKVACPKSDNAPRTLAPATDALALSVDSTGIYWVEAGGNVMHVAP